jgi:geranylgeranylglycerol-phosphate geranylgeranyltransferase
MFAYLEILRPVNCLIAALAVFAGGLIAAGGLAGAYSAEIIMAMAAVFLIAGGGNVINDYFDVEADKINRPKRPIPSGRMSRKAALVYSLILFAAGVALCAYVNTTCFAIAVINSVLLIAYSWSFQNKVLIGNIVISYLVGSVFIFGGAAAGGLTLTIILAFLSALAILSRELIKDLEDVEGDRKSFATKKKSGSAERFVRKGKEIKLRLGEKTSIAIAILSLLAAIGLSYLPYHYNILKLSYMGVVIPADIIFIFCCLEMITKDRDYGSISKWLKVGMVLALAAFVVGVLV